MRATNTNTRASSQKHYGSSVPTRGGSVKKEGNNAKEMLLKMKEIKAHYSKQANKGVPSSKNFAAKVADL